MHSFPLFYFFVCTPHQKYILVVTRRRCLISRRLCLSLSSSFYVRGGAFELWKPIPSWVPFCAKGRWGETHFMAKAPHFAQKKFFSALSLWICLKTPTRLTSLLLVSKIGRLNEVSPFPPLFSARILVEFFFFKRGGFKAPFLSFVWIRACTKFLMRAQWASRV